MKQSDSLDFVIVAVVCAIVHFLLGGSAHESLAHAFRFLGICVVLRAAFDVIDWLRR